MSIDWDSDIGDNLVDHYDSMGHKATSKYFNYFDFTDDDPLAPVVPLKDIDKFFGTKVQNILIIRGVFDTWPPDGFDESKARIIASYKYFAHYETLVWLYDPDGTRSATEAHLISMCDDLVDYGFTYMGRLDDTVTFDFFEQYIDPHIGKMPETP